MGKFRTVKDVAKSHSDVFAGNATQRRLSQLNHQKVLFSRHDSRCPKSRCGHNQLLMGAEKKGSVPGNLLDLQVASAYSYGVLPVCRSLSLYRCSYTDSRCAGLEPTLN